MLLRTRPSFELQMDRMFRDFFQPTVAQRAGGPPVNITDGDQSLTITAVVPGLSADDITITASHDELSIAGESLGGAAPEGYQALRIERHGGSFKRSFRFPFEIDADGIEAKVADGVLTLTVPKAVTHQPRKITVQQA